MAETFNDFFTALLYGNGAWLGVLLIISILVMLTLAWKYSLVITAPFALILAISYISENLPWQAILMSCYVIFALIYGGKEFK